MRAEYADKNGGCQIRLRVDYNQAYSPAAAVRAIIDFIEPPLFFRPQSGAMLMPLMFPPL